MAKKLKKIPIKDLNYDEWVELRMKFVKQGMVGGSDASTILGLNPWTSKINRWNQSLGLSNIHTIDNEVMFHGRLLEQYVADLWQYWTGDPIQMINNYKAGQKQRVARRRNFIFINEEYPWMFANLDREIMSHDTQVGRGILEIKTISSFNSDKWEGGIPPYYIAQVQLYMLVMDVEYCDMALLKDGRHMDVFTIERNRNIQETIIDESYKFWKSIQEARKVMDNFPDNLDQNTLYEKVSYLEPEVDDEYKVDLDKFLSDKHITQKNRIKIDGNEELEDLSAIYTEARDREKESRLLKQKVALQIKSILIKRGAEEVDFGEQGKIVWGKTFNVKYNPIKKPAVNF